MSPAGTPLWIDEVASPVGTILLVARDGILVGADFADCRHRLMGLLGARYEILDLRSAVDPFGFSARIQAYLAGDLDATSDISVDPGGTPFQQTVWAALRRIPAGRVQTYAGLARGIARPAAARAVGSANARNPAAIVIPCHRLVGSDASLTGYAGGLWRKRWLLEHEGAPVDTTRAPAAAATRG